MSLQERDSKVIWHPYTQMKTAGLPVAITRGEGAYLFDEAGKRYIDAISSWWVNLHGHAHPHIAEKVAEQLKTLEHVIFAGFTHPAAVELAERLLRVLSPNQSRIFFSDDGSTAVEVALKMSFQYWQNKGVPKNRVIALEGAYHGDTFGAMSVSGRSAFNQPFAPYLFDVTHIDFPSGEKEKDTLSQLRGAVEQGDVAAFIFEPLVQGAAGMRMYDPTILEEMMALCHEHEVLCIADEVMTGFGRTGKLFATDHVASDPDIYCLSKGLTGGTMALGVTSCTEKIYEAFLSDDRLKTFFHGHSFTANPVACAAACASLDVLTEPDTTSKIGMIVEMHREFSLQLKGHPAVREIRQTGTILAIELKTAGATSYFNQSRDGIYEYFIEKGLLLRPLGNVVYVLPPYCIAGPDLLLIYGAISELADNLA